MFADEARFGRMNRIRPCWAPLGTRPAGRRAAHPPIHLSLRRGFAQGRHLRLLDYADLEYGKLPGLPPSAGTQVRPARYLACSRRRAQPSLWRPCRSTQYQAPVIPPDSPELNPKENLWDEIREKIFKNFALKSMGRRARQAQAGHPLPRVPSGTRLEFGGAISGNMRLSFQAARSIG